MRTVQILVSLIVGILIGYFSFHKDIAPTIAIEQSRATSSVAAVASADVDYFPVVKVVDGDTVTIFRNGRNETLRLIGLDTPETVDPRKPVQCFGKAASDKARELLSGKSVRVEMDPSQGALDKYGRTLVYIHLPDGTLFNKYMIAEGYGHEYTYNLPYTYQDDFKAAELNAREQKKGLWANGACASSQTAALAPQAAATSFIPEKQYDCAKNAYNCSSFSSHAEAQYVFNLCGTDIHKLDRDGDGSVCESLP